MKEAILESTSVDIKAENPKSTTNDKKIYDEKVQNFYTFRTTGSVIKFDGFTKIYTEEESKNIFKEAILPPLEIGELLNLKKLSANQHFTEPPPRYTEASLIAALEKYGIGRPSTYAPILSTIQERGYVEKKEKKFYPKEIGLLVNDILIKHFPQIVDIKFTAKMEEDLDLIAQAKKDWREVLSSFYRPFEKNLLQKEKELSKKDLIEEKTKRNCPKCGKPLVIKLGRFGKFYSCSDFPKCKYTEPLEDKIIKETFPLEKCEKCGAPLKTKIGRFGKFLACSRYPECKFTKPIVTSTGVICPKCGKGEIIEKKTKKGKTFYACNQYPKCDFAIWQKPKNEFCPKCKNLLIYTKNKIKCSNKECDFEKKIERK
jgi:DNA topoisomerase-1